MVKIKVAVLGATGMIGQRFVQLLEDHPQFEIAGLYASERSEGKRLGDTLKVRDHAFAPDTLDMRIEQLDVDRIADASRVAFSGLPTDIAGDLESRLARAGSAVFSNAAPHRMDPDVPLLIPECNAAHLDAVKRQSSFKDGGYIVTNANCSTTGIAVPLKAVDSAFGLEFVCASTYQAISGAGYPGVPSLDIMGNVVPYIKSEEEKMEAELAKILGSVSGGRFTDHPVEMLASCARVPVVDGHLESVTLRTGRDATVEEMIAALERFTAEPQELGLPTAPLRPVIVRREADRPQPALDVNAGEPSRARGMSCTVGRVRKKGNFFKMFVLSHNTLRGGAGGSVLNAELANARDLL
ncbi:MAG: aspartate-semialdehyde dehydrogenase [Methanomassiliicoccus sp.]|nr:aspartate-semialdehyde dehydrogenase [Methanomassiliicoccus sp.]